MTHDYKPHGTTTLFAALSMLDGSVIAQCAPRKHYTEWLAFLRQIGREAPRDKALRLICDTYSTHKCPNVRSRLAKHPRVHLHFTPASAAWLNMVERFVRDLSVERIERGVFRSVPELVAVIDEYIAVHNRNPKPFIWTAKAHEILQNVIPATAALVPRQTKHFTRSSRCRCLPDGLRARSRRETA